MRTWHRIKTHLPCLINHRAVIPPLPIEVEGAIRWFFFVEKRRKTGQSYSQNLRCLYIFESTIEHFLLQGIFYSLGTVPKQSYSRSRGEFEISQTLDKYWRPKKKIVTVPSALQLLTRRLSSHAVKVWVWLLLCLFQVKRIGLALNLFIFDKSWKENKPLGLSHK